MLIRLILVKLSFLSLMSCPVFAQKTYNPSPVILIHGLTGSSEKWDYLAGKFEENLGWLEGGRMDFCLNADGNRENSLLENDVIDLGSTITIGDFYRINFDVNPDGTHLFENTVESNESSAYKQAYCIGLAISKVLKVTGANQVVLVGLSMGGISSRVYLQNQNFWQEDNKHHVSNLYTIGTPHGGSNGNGLYAIPFIPVNKTSEAARDCRKSYFKGAQGILMYGGVENSSKIRHPFGTYDNVDVNCNGVIGDTIVGLNNKNLPTDVEYVCSIGTGGRLGGDGVNKEASTNINNYFEVNAHVNFLEKPKKAKGLLWHNQLSLNEWKTHFIGIDETEDITKAGIIETDKCYSGVFQLDCEKDIDVFKFTLAKKEEININFENLSKFQGLIRVFSMQSNGDLGRQIYESDRNGKNVSDCLMLEPGEYIIEIEGSSMIVNELKVGVYTFSMSH